MKCICGKEFHACSSCGLTYNWEYKFCSEECWKRSEEYKTDHDRFIEFHNSLSSKQKENFRYCLDVIGYIDYEFAIEEWLVAIQEKNKIFMIMTQEVKT